ncbi:MAG: PRC-barrel domain-containing protein [Verrucomicrobiota bacterium]
MLHRIKQIYGNKLIASDGEIGFVKDLYFNDKSWAVRYLVVDTGTWLADRQVLLAPHAFGHLHLAGSYLLATLTRKQIEDSPSIETHKPVSRQYEEEYYQYYGWPNYWQGDGLWGMNNYPLAQPSGNSLPTKTEVAKQSKNGAADAHLRSTQAVKGYQIQASDGLIGHITDFMIDTRSWAIHQLVVRIGHRFTGKEVLIPTNMVSLISYEESTVLVNLTTDAIERSPAAEPHQAEGNDNTQPALAL